MSSSSTRIYDLPPELLAQILAPSSISFKVVDLWICGNLALNSLLARGGCRHVSLVDNIEFSTSTFPNMLCALRGLRFLSIKRKQFSLVNTHYLFAMVRLLSPTIESLHLECKESHDFLLISASDGPKPSIVSSQSNATGNVHFKIASDDGPSPLWSLRTHFTALHSLSLISPGYPSVLNSSHLLQLPKTLTSLKITVRGGLLSDFGQWPRSLLSISLMDADLLEQYFTPDNLRQLPPNLTSLKGAPIEGYQQIAACPRSLTVLPLVLAWTKNDIESLPPNLVDLNLFRLSRSLISYPDLYQLLPKSLTKLVLNSPNRNCVFSASHLPRTLTQFDCHLLNIHVATGMTEGALELISDSTPLPIPDWPSDLHFLTVYDCSPSEWREREWKLLPQGLVRLLISNFPSTTDDVLAHLPDGLRVLDQRWSRHSSIVGKRSEWGVEKVSTGQIHPAPFKMPPALRKLHVSDYFGEIGLDRLPRTIFDLSLNNAIAWQAVEVKNLPSGLTRLEVAKFDASHFGSLPQINLNTLIVRELHCTANTTTGDCTISFAEMRNLPASLDMIDLTFGKDIDWERDEDGERDPFAGLPRETRDFRFGCLVPVPARWLGSLPSKLTHLSGHIESMVDKDLKLLPRTLNTAYIGEQEKLSPNGYQWLPPRLIIPSIEYSLIRFLSYETYTAWIEKRRTEMAKRSIPVIQLQ